MTTTIDRRVIVRAIVVFLLAAAVITVISVIMSDSAQATDTATHVVAADTSSGDSTTTATTTATAGTNRILQSLVNGLAFGTLLALASVGLSLIYGTTGLSNFAHGEQVSFGAVLTYFLVTPQPVTIPFVPVSFTIGLPLVVGAIIAIAVSAGTGWLQDKFLWSPLRRRGVGTVQQMIVSIGLSLAMLNFIQWWVGGGRFRLTIEIDQPISLGLVTIGRTTLISLVIALACLGGVSWFLLKTRLGRATRAVSDNPALASASGIQVGKIIRLVWIIAAGLAGLGGILLGLYEEGTAFDAGARLLMLMFAAVTLGGLGQAFGALVGSLVIGVVAEMSTIWLPADLKVAVALVILILVLLVRPQGILGRAERVG
ncbi:branched-chain amino acid ABC transporter permease [Demequina capsici]|uniref:Branched-chain amino acid ABC transporter permease n=1 Tax=Demequina capsici TaxID=3075620 RepID=A0AA96FA95_9MICO|nr:MULTISPECIES: branched-chain amino acid ABC transporter permease [unclassified Demequina]WNM25939.1 branched-chain amino acid ABC transporter permease [Demequina sp. OYTSA14]WNM26044.1 branched-chain amino acid ABC transporter permease [Demequina sp. PMTSA13]